MTPAEFEEIMTKRHGKRWKTAAAREMGRHPVTIHKWMKLDALPEHAAKHVEALILAEQQAEGVA
jgi:hypothetical protein